MTLTQRLSKSDRREVPIADRRVGTDRPQPVWIQRMQSKGLPPVDHTSAVKVA